MDIFQLFLRSFKGWFMNRFQLVFGAEMGRLWRSCFGYFGVEMKLILGVILTDFVAFLAIFETDFLMGKGLFFC